MIKNNQLQEDFELLVKSQDWETLKSWFKLQGNHNDMVDKVIIWFRFFMPDYFRNKTPEFHRDLIKALIKNNNSFIAAPRGFSKTTIIQGMIAFFCANQLKKFIVLLEKSFTEASEVLDAVRTEFVDNIAIKMVYGVAVGKISNSDAKDKDAQGDMIINGVRIRGKGFDSPIRGMKYRAYRPDCIILDDIETDEHINSPEQRQKALNKYNKAIVPALALDGSVKMFGTILHFDSLLNNLIKWHNGKIYRAYNITNPEKTLLWKERWSYKQLLKKKKEMEVAGKGSAAFAQEYLNNPVDDEERTFKYEWLWNPDREYELKDLDGHQIDTYASIDPAFSTLEGRDYTGVVVVSIKRETDEWFFRYIKRERRNVRAMMDLIFEIWENYSHIGLRKIGIARTAFKDQVQPLFREECNKRRIYPSIGEIIEAGKNKEQKIEGALSGRAELGRLWFTKNATDDTEALRYELYNFPASKYDDLADAAANISELIKRIGTGSLGIPVSQLQLVDYSSARTKLTGI